jgi:hypothetical protein
MEKQKLKKFFKLTATNFKFKLDEDFGIFFDMIEKKLQEVPDQIITKNFQQLWLKSSEEWNKEFGYSGYPSFSDWIYLLAGIRPLTDLQIVEQKKQKEEAIKMLVCNLKSWTSMKDMTGRYFAVSYQREENKKIKNIVDKFYNIEKELSYDEISKLGLKIKNDIDKNWNSLKAELFRIAIEQESLLIEQKKGE